MQQVFAHRGRRLVVSFTFDQIEHVQMRLGMFGVTLAMCLHSSRVSTAAVASIGCTLLFARTMHTGILQRGNARASLEFTSGGSCPM